MNEERKPTFDYILNDMALLILLVKCLYSEYPSEQDKYDLEYQVKLLLENETKLKKEKYKAIEYIKDLLKEEFEITDTDNVDYGMKCQRAYFSDSELIKVLEILGDKENE